MFKTLRAWALDLLTFAVLAIVLLAAGLAPASAAPTAGVSTDVKVTANGVYYGTTGVGTPQFPLTLSSLLQLTPGTGAGKADKLYAASRTIAASTSENLDLAGGLTDPLGATLTFVKVKAILVIASSANTNNVVLGGAASNTFTGPFVDATDKVSVPPGGAVLLTHPGAGWTVTAATGDILTVANSSSGTTVTYTVLLIGTSV
jgi:hypothetical protein